jgi:hypothetical protein
MSSRTNNGQPIETRQKNNAILQQYPFPLDKKKKKKKKRKRKRKKKKPNARNSIIKHSSIKTTIHKRMSFVSVVLGLAY